MYEELINKHIRLVKTDDYVLWGHFFQEDTVQKVIKIRFDDGRVRVISYSEIKYVEEDRRGARHG